MKEALGQGRTFTSGSLVPWILLGGDCVPLVTNTCIQLIRHVYSCWMSNQIIAVEPNLEKECAEHCSQCTLNLDMAFCLAFMFSQIESFVRARQLCLSLSVLEKVLGKGCSVNI